MSNISLLDAVIRRIKNPKEITQNEELIIIDEKTGIIYQRPPKLYQSFGKKIRFFAVSNVNRADCAGFSYTISNALSLKITYSVTCPNNNENQVVSSLYKGGDNIENYLNGKIKNWVAEFSQSNSSDNAIQERNSLEGYIVQTGSRETGLSFSVTVKFENEDKLIPFPINTNPFTIRVKDYDSPLSLKYETELLVNQTEWELALKNYYRISRLEEKFKEIIKQYCIKNVALHQFCFFLSANMTEQLLPILNEVAEKEGRYLDFLSLTSSSIATLLPDKNPLEINFTKYDYKIKEYNERVEVTSEMKLDLYDVGLFKSKKIQDISSWFEENVIIKIVSDELYSKTYKEVLLQEATIKKDIEKRINTAANDIGYKVEQHTFIPKLKQLDLIKIGFDYKIEESYSTKDSRVPVTLQTIVKGRLKSLANLDERLLLPQTDIENEIKDTIQETIELIVHKIEPERMFMRFDYTDIEEETVVGLIGESIKKELFERYQIDSEGLVIIIKFGDNKVTKKAHELRKDLHLISIKINPNRGNEYVLPLDIKVLIKIMGVRPNGWPLFQDNIEKPIDLEIGEIKQVVESNIRKNLEAIPSDFLVAKSRNTFLEIDKVVDKALAISGESLGLSIKRMHHTIVESLEFIERAKSAEEKIKRDEETNRNMIAEINRHKENELDALLKAKKEALELSHLDEGDELAEIDKKIAALTKKTTGKIEKQEKTKALQKGENTFSFEDEFGFPPSLKEGGDE